MKLGIVGHGRMGRMIQALAIERGHDVVALIEEGENPEGSAIRKGGLRGVDVAVEFTTPAAAVQNGVACLEMGIPVVIGTTGWHDRVGEIKTLVEKHAGSLLWAPNFSVGVVVFNELVARAAALLAGTGFDAHLIETHHDQKLDAPSGTALALARAFEAGARRKLPITSVRLGKVPGTHAIHLDGPFEHIVLEHQARDRTAFADGALLAAEWLLGRQGIYTMQDVLGLTSDSDGGS